MATNQRRRLSAKKRDQRAVDVAMQRAQEREESCAELQILILQHVEHGRVSHLQKLARKIGDGQAPQAKDNQSRIEESLVGAETNSR